MTLLTIGHSNLAADRFLSMLRAHSATAVADVRSVPFSRRFPWFSARTLADRLQAQGITYIPMGDSLGGRPADPGLYCEGIADYEAMAMTQEFRAGLDRLGAEMSRHRLCVMCAEREPLDCHRCLLVGRALTGRSISVSHILGNGSIEPHAATEARLIAELKPEGDLFGDRDSRLAEAYRRRARKIGARLSDRIRPGRKAFMPS